MTDKPDPQLVREIARRVLLEAAADQDPNFYTSRTGRALWNKLRTRTGPTVDEFGVWFTAVKSAIDNATVTVSWPDEQPQDDGDVRAVAVLLKLGDTSFRGNWLTDYDDARSELESRFADRIAALEARDATAGEQR